MAQRCTRRSFGEQPKRLVRQLAFACIFCATFSVATPAPGASPGDRVGISALSDVPFGTIGNVGIDSVRSQSICLYAKSPPNNQYTITATGSGNAGAFLLSSGVDTLSYEVQWSDTAGQTSGSQLVANQPLTAQRSSVGAGDPGDCSKGPVTTASLIILLRAAELSAASSGTYTGTLTLLVAPE